jgi:hypothetical protein
VNDAQSAAGTIEAPALESPLSIFVRFLKFGLLAWGGPAGQIAMIKRECVDDGAGSTRRPSRRRSPSHRPLTAIDYRQSRHRHSSRRSIALPRSS